MTGVILSAAVDFHFNFIFGSFPLHLASVAQFCMDVDTDSPPVFSVVAFSSVLQFPLDLVVIACFTTYHSPCTTDSVTNKRFNTFKKRNSLTVLIRIRFFFFSVILEEEIQLLDNRTHWTVGASVFTQPPGIWHFPAPYYFQKEFNNFDQM